MRNLLIATIILAIGCGSESEPAEELLSTTTPIETEIETTEPKDDYDGSAKLVATVEGLECSGDNDGHLIYATDEGAFRYCEASSSEWLVIDLKGKDAPIPEVVETVITKKNCVFDMGIPETGLRTFKTNRYVVNIDVLTQEDRKTVNLSVMSGQGDFASIETVWFTGEDGFDIEQTARLGLDSGTRGILGGWSAWLVDGNFKLQFEDDPLDNQYTYQYDITAESCITIVL